MKRKKFLALALAGVMTAVTLTACAPLEDLYDWFFGGGSSSASRGNGVNLVEVPKDQIVGWFGLGVDDVFTDKSRTALEEVVGKLDADAMMNPTKNELNDAGQKTLNEVAKNQLPQDKYSWMCIDVMKWSPTSADAAPAIPDATRKLYWAQYTHGNGSTFGEGGTVGGLYPETSLPTYTSELSSYPDVKMWIDNYRGGSNVDFFAGTFTKDGKTYLAVAIIGKSMV